MNSELNEAKVKYLRSVHKLVLNYKDEPTLEGGTRQRVYRSWENETREAILDVISNESSKTELNDQYIFYKKRCSELIEQMIELKQDNNCHTMAP